MLKIVITDIDYGHEHVLVHSTIFFKKKLNSFKVRIGKSMVFVVRKEFDSWICHGFVEWLWKSNMIPLGVGFLILVSDPSFLKSANKIPMYAVVIVMDVKFCSGRYLYVPVVWLWEGILREGERDI